MHEGQSFPVAAAGQGSELVPLAQERIPLIVVGAGRAAAEAYVDYMAGAIANEHTRRAYHRAHVLFSRWCLQRRLSLEAVRPIHVAAYREELQRQVEGGEIEVTTLKLRFAAIRKLYATMVERGVVEGNPAREVSLPKFSRSVGKTPAFEDADLALLLDSIDAGTLVGKRDLALVSTMAYTFARVSAVVGMDVEDYAYNGRRAFVRLDEKGGKQKEVECHHLLQEALDDYLAAAGISGEGKGPLFRTVEGRTGRLTGERMSRTDAWRMVQRRVEAAGIRGEFGCHSIRASAITNYLEGGGSLEKAQRLAGHADKRTTALYDRREYRITRADIESINFRRER